MGSRIDIDDNLVIERYNELKNLKKVAKSFGVSLRPIKRILNKNNIELTNRRFNVNHSYFNVIDSEDKAYWLGFLFADGCVRKTKTGSQVVLKLSVKDENHLIKFKNDLIQCNVICASAKSKFGEVQSEFYWSEKYGFIELNYYFNKETIKLKLIDVIDNSNLPNKNIGN